MSIIDILKPYSNIRDTAQHVADLKPGPAIESYFKSIPGILASNAVLQASIPKLVAGTKLANVAKVGLSSHAAFTNWWTQPAKAMVKKTGVATTGKILPVVKKAGPIAAIVAGEYLISKNTGSVSLLEYPIALFNPKLRKEILDRKNPNTLSSIYHYVSGRASLKGILHTIDKLGGN